MGLDIYFRLEIKPSRRWIMTDLTGGFAHSRDPQVRNELYEIGRSEPPRGLSVEGREFWQDDPIYYMRWAPLDEILALDRLPTAFAAYVLGRMVRYDGKNGARVLWFITY